MFALQKSKSKTSSRNQIAIKGVRDGILMLPNNEYRAILQVSSLNFELRSEEEQDAIMDTYESFLNSVGSSLQILIRTREIDMDKYLEDLKVRLDDEPEQIYRDQLFQLLTGSPFATFSYSWLDDTHLVSSFLRL